MVIRTSNLLAHLKTNHGLLYTKSPNRLWNKKLLLMPQRSKETPVAENIVKCQLYEKMGKRYVELTNTITYCIAKDSLPLQTGKHTSFTAMLRVFDPCYIEITNCTTIVLLNNKRKGSCRNKASAFLFCNY